MDQGLLERILDISRRMAETRALKPLLNYVIDEAIALTGAERGYLVLVEADGSLDIRVKRGQGGEELGDVEDQISTSIFNQVVRTGSPLILRDALNDPNFAVAQSVVVLKLRSIMCVPFISRGETIGAIYVENRSIRNRFDESDLPPLILFANQAAIAIENAGLNDDLEARVTARTIELERSNRELQNFAYVASHDLQEPLRKVQVFGGRLQSKYAEALDETGYEYLTRMQDAVQRMYTLIDDLLTYSRVTTKGHPFEPVNLTEIARGVISDLEIRIEQEAGQVQVGDLPTIEADSTQMRQLLQNLIGNALKFRRPDEPPLVRVTADYLNGREGSVVEMCRIVVSDNGIGFDEVHVDRIFQVFQRLHGRSVYQGTGVGLAICRNIVERHNGHITAKSSPGQGASFIATLPVKQPRVGP